MNVYVAPDSMVPDIVEPTPNETPHSHFVVYHNGITKSSGDASESLTPV